MDIFIVTITSLLIAILTTVGFFQALLTVGLPLGEAAMGGYYKVLPPVLRAVSACNALILWLMCFVYLLHIGVSFSYIKVIPTDLIVLIFTIFLGINTIVNLLSKSKKEKYIMTPISGIGFILSLLIVVTV
ncbi:hypothetical protein [Shouchella hunanensis]|uniref:Uncharacterized protein n=1 Tax=Shouchella hunanensis TaxID=766894 RepID=A0ABY7VZF3_9BACI|nr:hypothetical protein [Shouchella hunanensis]WDF02042.1 hypothetical protein PQ477_10955 [Shouchella hunanensis]